MSAARERCMLLLVAAKARRTGNRIGVNPITIVEPITFIDNKKQSRPLKLIPPLLGSQASNPIPADNSIFSSYNNNNNKIYLTWAGA